MSVKVAILIVSILFRSQILAFESNDLARKGKFLGISGYLSGSTGVVPFWKQWNALLQVNVEKTKHKHNGVYIIPPGLYYPPSYGYGFYPHHFGGFPAYANSFQHAYPPMPLFFDEYKPMSTPAPVPINEDVEDKARIDAYAGKLNSEKANKNVSFSNLNLNDDRKTHKRDIEVKNQTEAEVVATVMEITDANKEETTTISSSESEQETLTETTDSPQITTVLPDQTTQPIASSSEIVQSTTPSTNIDSSFHPIYYYGGSPNENADLIFLTTEPPTDLLPPSAEYHKFNKRNDFGEFKPSIQYEYKNYRYDVDPHFIPIVGTQQVF